jgi:hypothetical protein
MVATALTPSDQTEAAATSGFSDSGHAGLDSVGVLVCTLTLRPKGQASVWTT